MIHPADRYAGQRVRRRRWALKLSQFQLAERCGIKFQQIQKYETGANRISVSRLTMIAKALDVPPSYFFEDGRDSPKLHSRRAIELAEIYESASPERQTLILDAVKLMKG